MLGLESILPLELLSNPLPHLHPQSHTLVCGLWIPACRLVFFLNWALMEHVISSTGVLDLPSRDIPIKGCITEHVFHVSNTADIPSRDIPNKGCITEHRTHVSNIAHIPLETT